MLKESRVLESRRQEHKPVAGKCLSIRDVIKMRERRMGGMSAVDATWLRFQIEAVLTGQTSMIGPFDGIDGAWKDQPCFVVGGSPGLRQAIADGFRFDMLNGFHSIGINHVVEDYHDFEWLFFLDKRLIDISTYDIMGQYRGRMFAHLKAHMEPSARCTVFYTQDDGPSEHIADGLYTFISSGLTAINLALISGANPIYLLGLDTGGPHEDGDLIHYKAGYTGEKATTAHLRKYQTYVPERLLAYARYADRFRNVDLKGHITVFPKIGIRDVPEFRGKFQEATA